jgi:hypothetical protein
VRESKIGKAVLNLLSSRYRFSRKVLRDWTDAQWDVTREAINA